MVFFGKSDLIIAGTEIGKIFFQRHKVGPDGLKPDTMISGKVSHLNLVLQIITVAVITNINIGVSAGFSFGGNKVQHVFLYPGDIPIDVGASVHLLIEAGERYDNAIWVFAQYFPGVF